MNKFNLPNLLSVSRAFLAPLALYLIVTENWQATAWILVIAIVTDLADGQIARRWHQTSPLGGFLDHGSDALLVSSMLAAEAYLGYVTPLLPLLVVCAFSQYSWDSKALQGQPLRASKLGRYNGILYFVVAGFPILQPVVQLELLSIDHIHWFSWIMVVTTSISMIDRGLALYRIEGNQD
ncbi:MAG: phosphatidylglycerophosphate synthase [Patiriisocius sp.]|jgi:phosphatidylglycerophosphate synthase